MVGDQGPSAGPRSPSGINDYMIECPLVGRSPITLVDIWEAGGRQAVGEGGQTQGGSGYRRTALGRQQLILDPGCAVGGMGGVQGMPEDLRQHGWRQG